MNHQDIPPKPASPPTGGMPRVHGAGDGPVPAPASVTWSQPHPDPGPPSNPGQQPSNKGPALWKVLFAVVILAVVAGLVWLALWLNSGAGRDTAGSEAPGVLQTSATPAATPLPLPRDGVVPAQYAVGDCFKDFDPEALTSTLVACDAGHSAQLVAVFHYPADARYPGAEALKAKALEACQAAKLGPAANQFQLNFQRSFPSSTSWESGDRRVDCYVTADGGNVISASVLP
ncbi:septum formation family protein [Arthrobacter sp. C152]